MSSSFKSNSSDPLASAAIDLASPDEFEDEDPLQIIVMKPCFPTSAPAWLRSTCTRGSNIEIEDLAVEVNKLKADAELVAPKFASYESQLKLLEKDGGLGCGQRWRHKGGVGDEDGDWEED
ncbi:hypothetical protein Pfo_025791 [Paulownia fortunei]|nr:hypothetical protein Pfo_025791 [Paulownia fortunei]